MSNQFLPVQVILLTADSLFEENLSIYINLKALSETGCRTWVSMEPYPTPNLIEQELQNLLEAVSFTDRIIFGRTNYCTEVTKSYPQYTHT